jgi:hypothetical protein
MKKKINKTLKNTTLRSELQKVLIQKMQPREIIFSILLITKLSRTLLPSFKNIPPALILARNYVTLKPLFSKSAKLERQGGLIFCGSRISPEAFQF